MMKILLLTDLHGQYGKLGSFLELEPDLAFIAGDLTDMGPCEPVKEFLEEFNVPCFAIPGNCDPKEIVDTLEDSDAICLHGASMTIGNVTITGVGGSNPTPFKTPFELTEEEIEKVLSAAEAHATQNVHNILLCHAPPFETLDVIGDNVHVGSTTLREHMKKYSLVCCGHIHEAIGSIEVDGTKVVNPGPASQGNCALITLGDEYKDIEVELLKV
ncbi:MAG: metallophosphoesterase family protein [Methanomicrobium sp.]|nr:metallophosphoesterase family protein [Methanomicrobium sp.]